MQRREFITLLGSAAAWPIAAHAQQGDHLRRIAVLMPFDQNDPVAKTYVSAFTQALADLGWADGRNVRIDLRWAGGDLNRIRALAQGLVGLQPDIIVASGTPATAALQRETRTIPIVLATVSDPVASGLVPRLDRPNGNVTGFGILEASLAGKWLELLSAAGDADDPDRLCGRGRSRCPAHRPAAQPAGRAHYRLRHLRSLAGRQVD